MHYPGKYNNDDAENDEIFKDKSVLNQPAGNIEFVNTKDSESIAITHKNGSFVKFDKFGTERLTTRDHREHVIGDSLTSINGSNTVTIDENDQRVVLGDTIETTGDAEKWKKPMTQIKNAQKELHDSKRLFELRRTNSRNSIDQAPGQTKSGNHATCPSDSTTSKMIKTSSSTIVEPEENAMPRTKVITIKDNSDTYQTVTGSGNRCMTCWGKLLSPSTQDGIWETEPEKAKIAEKREEVQKKIYEYEKQLGQNKSPNGGNSVKNVAKNFIENIGLVFNDFESFRKDPNGKLVPCGIKIDPLGTTIYTQYRDASLIEQVDVEKLPGGSYELNINDGWKATVGSNGIEFKTTGPLNLFGTLVNLTGEQINIGSRGEIGLDGERIDITADIISIRPKKLSRTLETGGETEEEQQLLIDGNLQVGLNATIRGGMHVEGELSTHHISAPCEYQMTETDFVWGEQIPPTFIGPNLPGINGKKVNVRPDECAEDFPKSPTYATLLAGAKIGYVVVKDEEAGTEKTYDVYSYYSENFAQVDPHHHYFKNVPLKLFQSDENVSVTAGSVGGSGTLSPHDAVRAVGSRNNWTKPVLPLPVVNSKTENTVLTKFSTCENGIQLNKTDWNEPCENDSLPNGEGVRTSQYTDAEIKAKIAQIEEELEAKYKELKAELAKIS
jgi:hypothetical protein